MTITESVACIGQRSACIVRATRLGSDCSWVEGDNNMVVAAGLVTLTMTPEVEEGTKFEPKDACGAISWTAEDPDVVKRYTLEGEFNFFDYALKEILTNSAVILGNASSPWEDKVIGAASPGSNTTPSNGAALEIWVKTAVGTGPCGDVADVPPYVRHVFPRVFLRPGDRTFANDPATMKVSGWAGPNGQWGEGPYGDWTGADPLPADAPHVELYDTDLPTAVCGYGTVASSA